MLKTDSHLMVFNSDYITSLLQQKNKNWEKKMALSANEKAVCIC